MAAVHGGAGRCGDRAYSLNYSGLNNVLAEGKSGYQIDVSYTEDGTGAVLTGNMENLLAGTELATLREEDGTEYDPEHFQMTVTENGTYTYTLEYGENTPETGKAVQREETLEVTVDQIRTEKEKNMSEPDLASDNSTAAPQQSSEQTGGGSQNGESAALSEDAPETVPLAVLEAELETL